MPLASVELIVLPFRFKLSTDNSVRPAREVCVLPRAIVVEPMVRLEEILEVVTPVTRPFAFTVITGIAV